MWLHLSSLKMAAVKMELEERGEGHQVRDPAALGERKEGSDPAQTVERHSKLTPRVNLFDL